MKRSQIWYWSRSPGEALYAKELTNDLSRRTKSFKHNASSTTCSVILKPATNSGNTKALFTISFFPHHGSIKAPWSLKGGYFIVPENFDFFPVALQIIFEFFN